ncbi:hypothetical protein DERF_008183 [Dermatophagoides farinae]|uniref:Uncharacterized protein n=1 Tax=Dermatophagoides farinae TaxID=6954 RepID=A0A922L584_DERFA|nr:hypothetical protein DERF_008183 [Dermatophagoides farinae]
MIDSYNRLMIFDPKPYFIRAKPSNCRYIFVALVMAYLRCDRKSIFLSIITPRTLASSLKTRSCPLMLMAGIGTGRIFLEIGTTVVFSDAKVNLFSLHQLVAIVNNCLMDIAKSSGFLLTTTAVISSA